MGEDTGVFITDESEVIYDALWNALMIDKAEADEMFDKVFMYEGVVTVPASDTGIILNRNLQKRAAADACTLLIEETRNLETGEKMVTYRLRMPAEVLNQQEARQQEEKVIYFDSRKRAAMSNREKIANAIYYSAERVEAKRAEEAARNARLRAEWKASLDSDSLDRDEENSHKR